jgi:hypothetical protein
MGLRGIRNVNAETDVIRDVTEQRRVSPRSILAAQAHYLHGPRCIAAQVASDTCPSVTANDGSRSLRECVHPLEHELVQLNHIYRII